MSAPKVLPRDARMIALIAASLGIENCEPGVLAALLEFSHRWAADLVFDSVVYHDHALKVGSPASTPTTEDLKIAVQAKIDLTCTNAWPKEYLQGLASNLNKLPLPEIRDSFGISLPPEEERLTNVNFDLKPKGRPPLTAQLIGTEIRIPEIDGMPMIMDGIVPVPGSEEVGDEDDGMAHPSATNGGDDMSLSKRRLEENDDEEEDEDIED